MVKTLIIPEDNFIKLAIPPEYIGKQLEVTYEPVTKKPEQQMTMADFWGILSDDTIAELYKSVESSKNEWERNI